MKYDIIQDAVINFKDFVEKEPDYLKDDKVRYYTQQDLNLWENRYDEAVELMNSEEHHQEGMDLILALAEEGYPEARRSVSDFYIQGIGVPEDFLKAVEWERNAVNAEHHLKNHVIQDNFNFPEKNE